MTSQPVARPWKMTPLLLGSAVVHAGALGAGVAWPGTWPWALGAVVADHALLTTAGLLPTSAALGPNMRRLPAETGSKAVALTLDDGPDPAVTPQVLDLLDAARVKASFFCIGWRARAHPALCREIVARGHSVENHGDAHSWAFSLYGPARMRRDVSAAQATLSDITGQAPLYFRPTAGLRNPFLEPVLASLGLRLASWSKRAYDTRTADVNLVVQRLTGQLQQRDILLMHDGNSPRADDGRPAILQVLPRVLHAIEQRGWQASGLPRHVTE
ncbi:polysaccharide deacetylase family protein [Hydrogenophaga sp. 5NK40-0174]|uniref:polysaccharide deacetylase family protein n=1 Tax=Hydrogenophaga sp. 5NK40-0174 TaxID=3127649 RepID=UPI00310B5CA5